MFQQFTQNVVNEDVNYFNNKIELHETGKKKQQKKNLKIHIEYYINPRFLNLRQENENETIISLIKKSKSMYPETKIKNTTLVLENQVSIDDKNYDEDNCLIYFTPEEIASKEEPVPLVQFETQTRNPRRMTNSNFLQKLKAMNLKSASSLKKKDGPSEKEIDMIKEDIKDIVIKIFKSEEVNLEKKETTELYNKLNLPFGRKFFISLLIKNTSNVILLNSNSAHFLWSLINELVLNTLKVEETDDVLEDSVLLIKISRYFGIQEEGETKTLFDRNIPKIVKFSKITQNNFWEKWYNLELLKNEKKKDDNKFKQSIIYDICQILIKLELRKAFVKNVCNYINEKEFGKDTELHQETHKQIINYITAAKYISTVI